MKVEMLKKIRIRNGLTLEGLAAIVEASRSLVSLIENGKRKLKVSHAEKIMQSPLIVMSLEEESFLKEIIKGEREFIHMNKKIKTRTLRRDFEIFLASCGRDNDLAMTYKKRIETMLECLCPDRVDLKKVKDKEAPDYRKLFDDDDDYGCTIPIT